MGCVEHVWSPVEIRLRMDGRPSVVIERCRRCGEEREQSASGAKERRHRDPRVD